MDVSNFAEAVPKIRELARKAGAPGEVSVIIISSDYAGYSKPLHVKAQRLTLAGLIDELAAQGDFYWDFDAIKLTIRPTKNE